VHVKGGAGLGQGITCMHSTLGSLCICQAHPWYCLGHGHHTVCAGGSHELKELEERLKDYVNGKIQTTQTRMSSTSYEQFFKCQRIEQKSICNFVTTSMAPIPEGILPPDLPDKSANENKAMLPN
jgi:hypothetical protein